MLALRFARMKKTVRKEERPWSSRNELAHTWTRRKIKEPNEDQAKDHVGKQCGRGDERWRSVCRTVSTYYT